VATLHFDVALSTTGGGAGVEKGMWEVAELMGHMRKQCEETLRTVYTVQCGAEYILVHVHNVSCSVFLHEKELSHASLSSQKGAVSKISLSS
jgi:hypothetical protein